MIVCPNCKEEIEERSNYCDQCGQQLRYCSTCGRVGLGRRCTSCGGMMYTPSDNSSDGMMSLSQSSQSNPLHISMAPVISLSNSAINPTVGRQSQQNLNAVTELTLSNATLGIHIAGVNGAVIGRRQGPYVQFFENNKYVSGVHAQLKFMAGVGWSITDKHSSNGTKLNNRPIQPDVDMSLRDGDIITIANVSLEVSVK